MLVNWRLALVLAIVIPIEFFYTICKEWADLLRPFKRNGVG